MPGSESPSLAPSMIYVIIAVTFFGFIGLAFVLLFPVYRFLSREEKLSENWTPEAIAKRQGRDQPGGDGAPVREPQNTED